MSEPMPVFVLKAKDNFAMMAIARYHRECMQAGLWGQAGEVAKALAEMHTWRIAHPDECEAPTNLRHFPANLP